MRVYGATTCVTVSEVNLDRYLALQEDHPVMMYGDIIGLTSDIAVNLES